MAFMIKYLSIVLIALVGQALPSEESFPPSETRLTLNSSHDDNQCSQSKESFCFNSTTKAYNCSQIHSILPDQIKCLDSGPALLFGSCVTYDEDTTILSLLPMCGYFQYGVYNVTIPGYIQLPTDLTELNDYMTVWSTA